MPKWKRDEEEKEVAEGGDGQKRGNLVNERLHKPQRSKWRLSATRRCFQLKWCLEKMLEGLWTHSKDFATLFLSPIYPFWPKLRKCIKNQIQKRKKKRVSKWSGTACDRLVAQDTSGRSVTRLLADSHLTTSRLRLLSSNGLPQPNHLKFNEDVCYFSRFLF